MMIVGVSNVNEPIYFTKILFTEGLSHNFPRSKILLDLPNRELRYQVYSWKRNMPVIQGIEKAELLSAIKHRDFAYPAKRIKNGKTNFEAIIVKDEWWKEQIDFDYGMKLSEQSYNALLPYCNALDYEPYRDKEMSMDDEGYIGYRDEINVTFSAITDSYIPYIELPMNYYYDEAHIWPSEKLYRYIYRAFLNNDRKLKKWVIGYGALSLFGV